MPTTTKTKKIRSELTTMQTCTLIWPDSVDFVDISLAREGDEWSVVLEIDGIFVEGAGLTPQDAVDNAVACLLNVELD